MELFVPVDFTVNIEDFVNICFASVCCRMLLRFLKAHPVQTRVGDPHSFHPDPDPAFKLNTDPDPGL